MSFPSRSAAVALADVRARLRRPGALVLLLVAAVGAWLVIPDPAPGGGLMKIGGARVLYTSPALAFATAAFFAFPLSLFGFYLVSNALDRDRRAHIAAVVAASPVRDGEYLLGKLFGNFAILSAVTIGFMCAAMAMQVVRGEGPLEPFTFAAHFLVLCAPCALWVAAIALVFECAPGLSGRLGDVLYFFVWCIILPIGAQPWRTDRSGGPSLLGAFDFMGLGFIIDQVQRIAGTASFTLGISPGDPLTPPLLFPGLDFSAQALSVRALSLLGTVLVAPLALVLFRRFDPARMGAAGPHGRRSLGALLNTVARPIGRPVLALLDRVAPDSALTFRARPPLILVALLSAVLSLVLPSEGVRLGLLPVLFVILSIALADGATRERASGMAGLVFSLPGRRSRFGLSKLGSASLVALVLVGVPAARLLVSEPGASLGAFAGLAFLAAASVALGIGTGTPKAFMAASLALWYVALNAKGQPPALDYGGWWGRATPLSAAGWLGAALAMSALALAAHRLRSSREM